MNRNSVFNILDFPIIRKAKQSYVEVKEVYNHYLVLEIDDLLVTVKKINGYPEINCPCDYCGAKGIATNRMCRRKIRALWFLIRYEGKISEIQKRL